jgi:hypothetical protein
LQQWASAISNLFKNGIINYTPEFEIWAREIADAPLAPGKFVQPTQNNDPGRLDARDDAATDNAEG